MSLDDTKPDNTKKPRWIKGFLAALEQTGNVSRSAKMAKIGRQVVYDRKNADPVFSQQWEDALITSAEVLEEEARRRAHDGLVRYKFKKDGEPIEHPVTKEPYYELEYSDTLLIFLLKGALPKKYRERLDISNVTDDEIAAAAAAAAAKLAHMATEGTAAISGGSAETTPTPEAEGGPDSLP